jgi:hypothetical protein
VICSTDGVGSRANPLQAITVDNGVFRIAHLGVRAMKMIVSALVALSVLAGIAGFANALDTKTFWEQQERQSY